MFQCLAANASVQGRRIGVSAYRRIGVRRTAYRRIGVSAYRRIGVSAYRRIGVSAYRRIGVSASFLASGIWLTKFLSGADITWKGRI
jgi:hypothetical protein